VKQLIIFLNNACRIHDLRVFWTLVMFDGRALHKNKRLRHGRALSLGIVHRSISGATFKCLRVSTS